ncbi:ABC transporter permease [Oscillibacter sp.]|uniref:ABC transporter permease n=1 Tax=Oscillibacter sp. TaxID=1945593 RepID=UPI001B4388C1|nr:ABC transporter permease [Oscillibacter sp.]MBP3508570.1 ABC transporter permease [Oscillibacter sp.]
MQSKTSFFNVTLFRKNLTRFWPLWGGASFLGSLFPLALLLQLMRGRTDLIHPLEVTEAYYNVLAYAVPILSLIYAILCAMLVWSYLYNARSVGLMHTLPITRKNLFVTNFLSGMAMMIIPYAVTGLLCILISLAFGVLEPVGLLVTILGVLGESFFYFASATFVAFMVGNIFALPAVYFLLHFLAVLLDWLLCLFAGNFIFGLNSWYSGVVEFLSPTVYLMERVNVNCTYENIITQTSITGAYSETNRLTAVDLENFWLIGVYALVGVAFLALAYILYARRRSESAGDVVAVGWMKPVFRFGLASLAALLGGQALYALFWGSFQDGRYYDALPMAVCMVVAGAIGYYAASMLLAKSLRVFRKSWKGLILVAAGCVALCCVLRFDLLGVSRRVPEASQVQEVEFYAADNTYRLYPGEDDALLEQVRSLHKAIVADQDYVRTYEDSDRRYLAVSDDTMTETYIRFIYTLNNGLKVERRYSIPLTKYRMNQDGTYDRLLDALVNSDTMKARRLHAGDDRYAVESGSLYLESSGDYFDLNSREASAILYAVFRDAVLGTWGEYDWFDQDNNSAYAMNLELRFACSENDHQRYDWISITVRPGMDNTVACLKELGLVTDRDLVTREAMEKMNNRDYSETVEYAEKMEQENSASIGVIGGADGPTTVVIAGVTA